MSDFHQIGSVTALPRLVARPVEELERRVLALSHRFPVALVIPMVPGRDGPSRACGHPRGARPGSLPRHAW